ncbi:MAG: hypothetical protein KA712_18250 [Myxococcales bacterium]|nr:hypothetical protein [Myxococcales bacterium]
MRNHEMGMFDSFEDFERSELRQLEAAYLDEMTDAFFEDEVSDSLKAVASWDVDD